MPMTARRVSPAFMLTWSRLNERLYGHLNINRPILNSIQQYLPLLTLHLLQLDLNRYILNQL